MNKKNIMIIGAGGSLGKILISSLLKDYNKVIGIDINENSLAYLHRVYRVPETQIYIEDLRDFSKIVSIIDHNKIDLVINCAALKHVLWCEYNIKHAIDINIVANLELINYLSKNNKDFIFISSDKAVNPQNIYALTKQFTDYIVKFYNFKLVRGVNFFNSHGSVLNVWEEQRKRGEPFTVVKDNECNRFFITIPQMVNIVREAIEDKSDKNEYVPKLVYQIGIRNLFNAYLKINNIIKYDVHSIYLSDTEKISEELNFLPKIIQLEDIDDIAEVLNKIY